MTNSSILQYYRSSLGFGSIMIANINIGKPIITSVTLKQYKSALPL